MKHSGWRIAKNAVSNAVRGGATAIVAMLLPHFMSKSMGTDEFAAWSLILQIAAYASFLDFGLQATVARYIAQAVELDEHQRVREIISAAATLLSVAAVLAIAVISIVMVFAPTFFRGVPESLLTDFRHGALILGIGTAALLPLSTFTGVLIGLHKNEMPAFAIGASRLIGAGAAIWAARSHSSLAVLALCITVPNLLAGLLQWAIVQHSLLSQVPKAGSASRAVAKDLLRYCAGLTVWTFAMLMISGLDVTVVAHYDFRSAGYYSLATSVTSIMASANSSILSAFLAPFAAMHATRNYGQVRRIVVRATRINSILNVLGTAVVIGFGGPLLRLWIPDTYADAVLPVLIILMIGQTVRLNWSSYSIALMATDHQNECIIPAIIEGVVNLGVSIWAVQRFGMIGVAFGTVVGSLVAVPALLIFTIKSREDLPISRIDLLFRGAFLGSAPALPLVAVSVWRYYDPLPAVATCAAYGAAVGLGAVLQRVCWTPIATD